MIKNMKKMISGLFFTLSFMLVFLTTVQAALKSYAFSDLDVALQVPDSLYVATRTTTSADPILNLMNISLEELKMSLSINNIYLEAFPEDLAYEIVLTGNASAAGAKDFNSLSEADILASITEKNKDASYSVESINGNQYLVTRLVVPDSVNTAYILKYTTVWQGKTISLTLQSGQPHTEEMSGIYNDVLRSMEYKTIRASLAENPLFTELSGVLFGIVITIAILGIILWGFLRLDRKSKAPKS